MTAGASENSGSSSNSGHSYGSTSGSGYNRNSSFSSGHGHNSGTGTNWGSNRGRGTSENVSRGYSEGMEYAIEPGDFGRILKTGGKANGNRVTGIWFQGGRIFKASGNNFMLETFKQ